MSMMTANAKSGILNTTGSPKNSSPSKLRFAEGGLNNSLNSVTRATARPSSAPALNLRTPNTMLDNRPAQAKLPGYTGHQPGMVSESMLGKSYAYLTGYRKDLLFKGDDAWISEYHRSHCREGSSFEPHLVHKPINGKTLPQRGQSASGRLGTWENNEKFFEVLNLNQTGRMPGYTGHVPHFKFQGSVGLPYGKACNTGDHLRPPDGSHNPYIHFEPQRGKTGIKTSNPIAGYAGFVPFMQETSTGYSFRDAMKLCEDTRALEPAQLRKVVDRVHAGYTPSMKKSLESADPHQEGPMLINSEVMHRNVEEIPERTHVAGYSGFRPGMRVCNRPPEQYHPKFNLSNEKRPHKQGSLYLGDLTQEWNLGTPYKTTNDEFGHWTANSGNKAKLWLLRC